MLAFELCDIVAGYEDRLVIRSLSCTIEADRTTVLVGPGGSGKSTLLRLLGSHVEPLPASLWHRGRIWRRSASLAVLGQRTSPGQHTMGQILDAVRGEEHSPAEWLADFWREVAAPAAQTLTGHLDQPLATLPRSLRRLAEVTLVLSMPAAINLIDEPEVGADEVHCWWMQDKLAALRSTRTLVVVTHNVRLARAISDNTVLMVDGEIIEAGSTRSMFCQPAHERTKNYIATGG